MRRCFTDRVSHLTGSYNIPWISIRPGQRVVFSQVRFLSTLHSRQQSKVRSIGIIRTRAKYCSCFEIQCKVFSFELCSMPLAVELWCHCSITV